MRRTVAVLSLACAACASGADGGFVGPASIGSSASASAATDASTSDGASESSSEASAEGSGCTGECSPGDMETRPCPGQCAVQQRFCDAECNFGPWSVCGESMGVCEPGDTMSCGMCMQQSCGDDCQWGACEAVPCVFECQAAARNGSEICDDEGFQMPDGPLFLYCEDGNGGVAYVANNTGPEQEDGVARCQGWEDMGLNAWDHLDYVHMMDCDQAGRYLEITLPPGTISHFGVHDQPDGSGHLTTVCVATLVE